MLTSNFLLCTSPPIDVSHVLVDALHKADPNTSIPTGTPGKGKDVKGLVYSSAKAEKVFKVKFKTLDETAPATFNALKDRGF